MAYPIGYVSEFVAERSRLTTFFRLLLVIPAAIVAYVYAIVAFFAVIVAWFALVLSGKWPRGLYDVVAGAIRVWTRVSGYVYLLTDRYPTLGLGDDDYPVRVVIPEPKESYSRLRVLLRILLAIPVALINYALGIVAQVAVFIAWFVIVFTGRQIEGLQKATDLGLAYGSRSAAYFCLLTEDWPPFSVEGSDPLGPATPAPELPGADSAPASVAPTQQKVDDL